jgi:hypothetical protein
VYELTKSTLVRNIPSFQFLLEPWTCSQATWTACTRVGEGARGAHSTSTHLNMSGRGKGGKASAKSKSRSSRAGLQFPVGRVHRHLKQVCPTRPTPPLHIPRLPLNRYTVLAPFTHRFRTGRSLIVAPSWAHAPLDGLVPLRSKDSPLSPFGLASSGKLRLPDRRGCPSVPRCRPRVPRRRDPRARR